MAVSKKLIPFGFIQINKVRTLCIVSSKSNYKKGIIKTGELPKKEGNLQNSCFFSFFKHAKN